MVARPFAAWAGFVRGSKQTHYEHLRLAQSYIRCKNRKLLRTIVRTWRHQSVYGRIDGMYTRKMLLDSLSEQKQMTSNLQKFVAQQMIELEQCKEIVESETAHRLRLEEELEQGRAELRKQVIIGHHGDQERRRLETLIEAMGIINPKQIEHLQSLQLAFQFRPRKVIASDPPLDYLEEELSKHDATSIASGADDVQSLVGEERSLISDGNSVTGNIVASSSLNTNQHADDNASQVSAASSHAQSQYKSLVSQSEERSHVSVDNRSVMSNITQKDQKNTLLKAGEINSVLGCDELSQADRLLLLRTKWLMAKFKDWDIAMNRFATSNDHVDTKNTEEQKNEDNNDDVCQGDDSVNSKVENQSKETSVVTKQLSDDDDDIDVYDDEDVGGLGLSQMDSKDLQGSSISSEAINLRQFKVELPTVEVKPRDPILPPRQVVVEQQQTLDTDAAKKDRKKTKMELQAEAAAEAAKQELERVKAEYEAKKNLDVAQLQSTRLLFSCLEFLQDGNLSLLDSEDRQDWIRTVVSIVDIENTDKKDKGTEDGSVASVEEAEAKLDLAMAVQALENMSLANAPNDEQLWALAAEDDVLKSKSWRRSLILLKTMYPDPGTGDDQRTTNLYNRLSAMRENMESVLNRNVEKLRELRQGILASAENRVNLYASQIIAPEREPSQASVDSLALLEKKTEELKLEEESTLLAWSGEFPQKGVMKLVDAEQEAKMKKKFEADEDSTVGDLHSKYSNGSAGNSP